MAGDGLAVTDRDLRHDADPVTRSLREQLLRREADARLVAELAAEGFAGRRYRRFEDQLVRYGLGVLKSWMYSGYVFSLVARRGRPLHPSDDERRELRESDDVRTDIAGMTVALALPPFRREALVRGGWRPAGGAGLTTYFMGRVLQHFPNEFRTYQRERRRWLRDSRKALLLHDERVAEPDPATDVAAQLRAKEYLAALAPLTARIVELHMADLPQGEIAAETGLSTRAVEGQLRRLRVQERGRRAGGGGFVA